MIPLFDRPRRLRIGIALVAACLFASADRLRAQTVISVATSDGDAQEVQLSPAGPPQAMPAGAIPVGPDGRPIQPSQPHEGKPGEGEKKKEGEGGDKEKKEEPPTTIKRPEKPPRTPDPREFDIKLTDKGQVPPFNFIGQPWPDVMQWLASISKCSLDWQELPNDFVNLTTQRPYSVEEVHDLINRHLSARGFTSIRAGEVLSVFKIEKLDPSLVRRVTEDELYDLKPYDIVKVSFELPAGLEVDKAKDEVKQVLNSSAKIFPLVAAKRLLIMDCVANLRTVSELLNQERMVQDGRVVPKEFVLKHARPEKVIDILYVVLGMDPKSRPTQMDLQLQQQKLQIMAQMQQHGTDVSKLLKQDGPPVYLAYNRQRNSVLVNAPPEQMRVIEQTIHYLDVPFGSDGGAGESATAEQRTMKRYQLTTLDPGKFITTLEDIGGLSPTAELKSDDDTKTLFAMASAADQARITGLVDQFDGSGRQFEVIWLRKLPADQVAASIFNLMAGQAEKDEQQPRYRPWYFDMDDREEKKKKPIKGFGVDADIERNRLLLWANKAEMDRVRDLLVKLGELPGGPQDQRSVRLIAPSSAKETPALIEKLRAAWPTTGSNQLIINGTKEKKPVPVENSQPAETTKPDPSAGATDGGAKNVPTPVAARVTARYAQSQVDAAVPVTPSDKTPEGDATTEHATEPPASSSTGSTPPPVTITVTEDGRLIMSSPDMAALDRMEELIDELTPPEKRFHVFPIRYVRAIEIWYDLNDFFKDELAGKGDKMIRDWNGFMVPAGQKDTSTGLSKRRKLMITYDRPSNGILVANASATQLAEIQQLIEQFDKPAPNDSVEIRQTAAIKILYSRPSLIAAAVKEVYRDLLSKRDKEFDRGDKREDRSNIERMTVLSFGGSGSDSSGSDRPSPVKIGFDGALSLGADDVSGVLIVSAQKALFDDIVRMVHELDNQAAPKTTVQVHHITGNVSAQSLQKALDKAVGKAWLGNKPEQQPNQTGPDGNKKRGEGNRNQNRGENQGEGGNANNNAARESD